MIDIDNLKNAQVLVALREVVDVFYMAELEGDKFSERTKQATIDKALAAMNNAPDWTHELANRLEQLS